MRLRPELRPDPAGEAYSAPQTPQLHFFFRGRGREKEWERKGDGNGLRGKRKKEEGRESLRSAPKTISCLATPMNELTHERPRYYATAFGPNSTCFDLLWTCSFRCTTCCTTSCTTYPQQVEAGGDVAFVNSSSSSSSLTRSRRGP